ncbi:MAG: hypothetical protein ACHBN1_31350 [Heteroscytonema crispum UTEX LB 1556]
MTSLNIYLKLLLENLLFVTLATSFFVFVGWVWRDSKPFSIPQPLPPWFKVWLSIVLVVGLALPVVVMLLWGVWWGYYQVGIVLASYFLMLGLQILSEKVTVNKFQSCVWVTIPCVYLPYRFWQLYEGLGLLSPEPQLMWVRNLLILEIVLWIFNYGVHLSQLPRLLRWDGERGRGGEGQRGKGGPPRSGDKGRGGDGETGVGDKEIITY